MAATIGQIYERVYNTATGQYESSGTNIYSNIVPSGSQFIKLGIQAPPGTKAMIEEREIIIGRTGMYELDDDSISLTSVYFLRNKVYEPAKDADGKDTSERLQKEGLDDIKKAEADRKIAMDALDKTADDYGSKYIAVESVYQDAYQKALDTYLRGVNGVYTLKGEANLDNVIIDYIKV